MDKKALTIGISIIIGFLILGISIIYSLQKLVIPTTKDYRYEMVSANETNIIIFDKETGRYWRKFIEPNGGPTEWTEEVADFLK
ncbi:hypothetical protein J2Z35_002790 [Acetoanaerobium pronyense]|uniref:Uncharacterized protein n=1 Tax=Acetoanaerobium pronyense TaxID=1482736 RepID=A0ABS4KME3_9FIRM|nr:hypothetical protein [Acetoanaerobium pronyense]MBP2028952.1 hypothetical protein [Acetoanaerobium pronyense]